eukprot:2378048-Amphidinium_carterae.1
MAPTIAQVIPRMDCAKGTGLATTERLVKLAPLEENYPHRQNLGKSIDSRQRQRETSNSDGIDEHSAD